MNNKADNLSLPYNEEYVNADLSALMDNTNTKHIYLSSDWHLFKNHYKKEKNDVNTQKIITWCRENIKDDDIFMYLGDISFRYANEEDQKESMKIMSSLPGIKVLILGNHDRMLGDDYYNECGFKYVMEDFQWQNIIFTHRPINMSTYPDDYINIHGHIHKWTGYNTTDGKRNINVYPSLYDNKPVTLDYILNHVEELTKNNFWNNNAMLPEQVIDNITDIIFNETKRSNLPDSAFGIPEDRKYPLDTKAHVKSAIKLFGHAEESKKKSLAIRIRDAAKKYDISIPETTQCYKYLSEGGISETIPDNVNTIIFDFGNVLVHDNLLNTLYQGLPLSHLLVYDIYNFLIENFFNQKGDFDLNKVSVDKAKDIFFKIAPDNMKAHTDAIFEMISKSLYKHYYTDGLLKALKSKGYLLYYLSNWDRWEYELEDDIFRPIMDKFDGGLFSFESKYEKPDKEFYIELINKYNLNPATCLFFDDQAINVMAAESLGMHGMVFDKNEIPKILLRDNINIPFDANNTIIINTGITLEAANLCDMHWWCCSSDKNPIYNDNDICYDIKDAISCCDIKNEPVEKYMFICNKDKEDHEYIPVGQVLIYPDKSYEWLVQYPINCIDGTYSSVINEWSMAACNPIRGIVKPYILKVSNDSGSIINTKQYALSPDIISDKYLVVNENAKLQVVDSKYFNNCYVEVYEFIGNKAYLNKLNEIYKSDKTVDNTVFYTALTGKPMLCEDQIDFDPDFKKVDFELMRENVITEMATIKDKYLQNNGLGSIWCPIIESNYINKMPFMSKYNKYNDISIREDFDGYYFYNSTTEKRSGSVATTSLLSEAMIKSIL